MKYLNDYIDEAQTKIFKEYGAFFAFSNKQFDESKKENTKYISMGAGLICPENNVPKLIKELDNVFKNGVKQDVSENGAKKIIEREYFNHETQISMDDSAALSALSIYKETFPELFTDEFINQTFGECFNIACEKDLF